MKLGVATRLVVSAGSAQEAGWFSSRPSEAAGDRAERTLVREHGRRRDREALLIGRAAKNTSLLDGSRESNME